MKWFLSAPILILMVASFVFGVSLAKAASQGINATVKNSICGNNIKEAGEECDNSDIVSGCADLGFTGGTLGCNVACGFDTSSCTAPVLDPSDIASDDVDSLVAAGLLTVPSSEQITSADYVTTTTDLNIGVTAEGGTNTILLPADTTIAREDGEPFNPVSDLSVAAISVSQITGLTGYDAVSSLQWGIEGAALTFDVPITIDLFVSTSYSGETLQIYRSEDLSSGWKTEGLVNSTCVVTDSGYCSFQTTKASYFAAAKLKPTPAPTATPTPGTSTSSSTTTSSSTSTTPSTPVPTISFKLPDSLLAYDIRMKGHLYLSDLETMIQIWIDSWKSAITNNTALETLFRGEKCDINMDGVCNMNDFSVLMYYIGR